MITFRSCKPLKRIVNTAIYLHIYERCLKKIYSGVHVIFVCSLLSSLYRTVNRFHLDEILEKACLSVSNSHWRLVDHITNAFFVRLIHDCLGMYEMKNIQNQTQIGEMKIKLVIFSCFYFNLNVLHASKLSKQSEIRTVFQ